MKLLLLGAATIVAAATPAFAQDDGFTGVYVGGTFGYSVQNNDVGETIVFDRDLNGTFGDTVVTAAAGSPNAFSPGFCNGRARTNAPAGQCENDRDNVEYSARIGFDQQYPGGMVLGVVLDAGKSRIRDSVSAYSTTPASYSMTRKIDWTAGLRLRAGYAAGNNTLFYATGGATYAKVEHSFRTTNALNAFEGRGKDDAWGFTAGGGVEQKLASNISMSLEYLYTRFKDDEYTVRATRGTSATNNPFVLSGAGGTDFRRSDENFDYHGIRTALTFRF
ncbi:MAG: porin family protein [Sphingomonadales bacterium]|nr:MAG: porin family protein [Sphingomonadales bacterium]